ncbi:Leo1-like protein-domain-containing protein [Russula earlei]|uniref:Leo1-like protein-domain-containing protein n=1 Tax=Russula earlei TaxID=71964 RepID=A0ACC0UIP5_9AGAM|nr:Leo1-like protein-domain-containing protein [Russula earlei]
MASSSLAGALVPEHITYHKGDADVDMHPSSLDDVPPSDPAAAERHPKQEEEMGDLFGEDADVDFVHHGHDQHHASGAPSTAESRYSSPASAPPPDDGLTSPDRKRRQALEYEEEEEPNPLIEHRLEASVSIPNIPLPKSSDGQHWVIRMPNFVKVDSKPFHPDTYIGPEHEEDFSGGAHDRDMGIKLRVENTVRWRWTKDKTPWLAQQRQSNAHVIRWSDGSMSLRLGKEYFDINQVIDSSGSAHRQAFGLSQNSQSQSQGTPTATPSKAHGLTYLVAQHKRAEILQAEAAITGFLTLRPTDMQSGDASPRHMDPEREKQELIRASVKKTRYPRADEGGGVGGTRRRRASGGGRRRSGGEMDIWSDDEDAAYDAYANDDDGDGRSPKKRRAREPDERRGGEYQTDDFVVADSDEDEGGVHGSDRDGKRRTCWTSWTPKSASRRLTEKGDGTKRRKRRKAGKNKPEKAAMEVESEEDEEELRVRRVGGARKRSTVAGFDEEDE